METDSRGEKLHRRRTHPLLQYTITPYPNGPFVEVADQTELLVQHYLGG